jgi:hypothetical protein
MGLLFYREVDTAMITRFAIIMMNMWHIATGKMPCAAGRVFLLKS